MWNDCALKGMCEPVFFAEYHLFVHPNMKRVHTEYKYNKRLYWHYYDKMCHFIIFLIGGVPLQCKNVTLLKLD